MKRKFNKITGHAKAQDCQIRIYPYCNGNPETTVFCHAWTPDKGIGIKSPDYWGAFGCSTCHDIVDGRMMVNDISKTDIYKLHTIGIYRTMKILFEDGVIKV